MVVGALSGAVGLGFVFYMLFTEGHAAFNTSSDMAWGAPIAFYLFFLLTSSGLSIIASLDTVFGLRVFYPIAKRAVFLSIDLSDCRLFHSCAGNRAAVPHALGAAVRFQVRSPMWWMGVFYSIDLVLLFIKFYLIHTGDWHSRLSHFVARLSSWSAYWRPARSGWCSA